MSDKDKASDPGDKASDPGDKASDPGDKASDPGDKASDPGDKASDSGDKASDSGDKASDSGDKASDSGDKASDSGDKASFKYEQMEVAERKPKKKSNNPLDENLSPFKRSKITSGSCGTSSAVPQVSLDKSSSFPPATCSQTAEDETSITDRAILQGAKPKARVSRVIQIFKSPSRKEKSPAKGSVKSPARVAPDQHQKPPAQTGSSPPATHSEADEDKTTAKDKALAIASIVGDYFKSPSQKLKSSAKCSAKSPARVAADQHQESPAQTSSSPAKVRDQECKDEKNKTDNVAASAPSPSHKSKGLLDHMSNAAGKVKQVFRPPPNILNDIKKFRNKETAQQLIKINKGDPFINSLILKKINNPPRPPTPSPPTSIQDMNLESPMDFESAPGGAAAPGTSGGNPPQPPPYSPPPTIEEMNLDSPMDFESAPGDAAASGTPGDAAASGTPGGAAASGTPGGAAASGTPGGAAASGTPGGAAASGTPGGAAASGTPGGAAASGTPGGAAAPESMDS